MTRHRIAQISENRNPKSPENRPKPRRFLQIRILQLRRSATPFNGLAVLHGRLNSAPHFRMWRQFIMTVQEPNPDKVAWSVKNWCRDTDLSPAYAYELINEKK